MKASAWMPIIYFILGQVGWFACVLSAAHGIPSIGAFTVALLVAAHLATVSNARRECRFLLFVTLLGGVWESLLVRAHLLGYSSGMIIPGLAPYWIVVVWLLFGAQINVTYRWLKGRPLAAALLGAVAGPASFRAGAALGALAFLRPLPAALTLAAGWAVILPLLMLASRRWDGVHAPVA